MQEVESSLKGGKIVTFQVPELGSSGSVGGTSALLGPSKAALRWTMRCGASVAGPKCRPLQTEGALAGECEDALDSGVFRHRSGRLARRRCTGCQPPFRSEWSTTVRPGGSGTKRCGDGDGDGDPLRRESGYTPVECARSGGVAARRAAARLTRHQRSTRPPPPPHGPLPWLLAPSPNGAASAL
jgi:hypothetical protein